MRAGVERVGALLFAEGWLFLVPYLVLLLGFRLAGTHHGLVTATRVVNLLLAVLFVAYAWVRRGRIRRDAALFWSLLAALFVLPGAYLEYPSDTWEHLRRILLWSQGENPRHPQLAYLLGWSWLGGLEIEHRRAGLAVFGAFWQLLIAFQFYRVALRLGMPRLWARVQVLGTVFFMGNTALGFYRYYALSHLPIAYVAYLQALISGIDLVRGRRPSPWKTMALLALMAASHVQALMFTLVSATALAVHAVRRRETGRRLFRWGFPVVTLAGCALALALLPEHAVAASVLNRWALWRQAYVANYYDTLGAHGVLGVVAGLLLWRRQPLLSLLTLAPVFLLFWPPVAVAFATLLPDRPYVAFRLLYGFPTSFALVALARWVGLRLGHRLALRRPAVAVLVVAVLVPIALEGDAPVRGRLWFQLHRPSPPYTLESIDVTSEWLREHRFAVPGSIWDRGAGVLVGDITGLAEPRRAGVRSRQPTRAYPCALITDGATAFAVATHLSLNVIVERRVWHDPRAAVSSFEELLRFADETDTCGFLLSKLARDPEPAVSAVGATTRHWVPDVVPRSLRPPGEYVRLVERLPEAGWTATAVPPWYVLYERPAGARTGRGARLGGDGVSEDRGS